MPSGLARASKDFFFFFFPSGGALKKKGQAVCVSDMTPPPNQSRGPGALAVVQMVPLDLVGFLSLPPFWWSLTPILDTTFSFDFLVFPSFAPQPFVAHALSTPTSS